MDVTDFGLCKPTGKAHALIVVNSNDWDDWLAAQDAISQSWIKAQGFTPRPGNAIVIPTKDGGVSHGVGVIGKHAVWDGAGLAAALPNGQWAIKQNDGCKPEPAACEMLALGWALSQYSFTTYRSKPKPPVKNQLEIPANIDTPRLLGQVQGTWLCRDLINIPANHLNPQGLEDTARDLAKRFDAKINVVAGKTLAADFPAIDIVGRAAEVAPRLIDMSWGQKGPKITLIGKGITFDSGGLDLKPSKAMEMMKKDMGGSAHVLGLAVAIMTAEMPVRLRVIVAAAENAVSEKSMRPLDVIDTRAKIKVEVGNTDAEGRLVLADALTLAGEESNDFVIDFATLTGAARVALGTELPALFCNQDDTAAQIIEASNEVGDPLWRLPLFDDYERHLDNGYAALSSTGSSGMGGAITAALFLRRFAGTSSNWAHIDVMAWNVGTRPGRPKGGEAMGLRAIYRHIEKLAAK
ncbi:leucyl aminopeptidase family protein [Alphaproteobacteria bacterium]|jgi:leucyl aminopeptidase|nr:leucyl aminopeptidase family protein [Alphaproteobacteria bacterium]